MRGNHRCGYLFIYYHNEPALFGILWPSYSLSYSPRAPPVISLPHLISLPDHTHRLLAGILLFLLPLLVVQFKSVFFSLLLLLLPSPGRSIMRVHYASVCLDNVPRSRPETPWSYGIVSFCRPTAFLSFQFC